LNDDIPGSLNSFQRETFPQVSRTNQEDYSMSSPQMSPPQSGSPAANARGLRHRRQRTDLVDLPRSAAVSHMRRAREAASKPNSPPESSFAPSAMFKWARHYLPYVIRDKHFFPPYTASPQSAMYDLLDEHGLDHVRIALAGDWGTGTDEAAGVAKQMLAFNPHFTVHIGDVYYVGDPVEVNENCLGIRNPINNYDPALWPIGTCGSFAMNGNHEMYANGIGYFDVLLPRLGLRRDGRMLGQQTSFFCLQNAHWRLIAVDTGYNSIGIPVLEQIPFLNKLPFICGNCRLPDALMAWLREIVIPQPDKPDSRGIVLLSHQQYYSGFDSDFRKPARQLFAAGIKGPVLWFWGHEHRFAGYDLFGKDQLKAHGRCVGHGGMPLEIKAPERNPHPKFWDGRKGPEEFGVNGHVNLEFNGPQLHATYVDLHATKLVTESWAAPGDGTVQLLSCEKVIKDPDFHGPS